MATKVAEAFNSVLLILTYPVTMLFLRSNKPKQQLYAYTVITAEYALAETSPGERCTSTLPRFPRGDNRRLFVTYVL